MQYLSYENEFDLHDNELADDTHFDNIACVAGGISHASAFVLVAKPLTRVASRESRVEFSPRGDMAAPPLARSRIPPATQAS